MHLNIFFFNGIDDDYFVLLSRRHRRLAVLSHYTSYWVVEQDDPQQINPYDYVYDNSGGRQDTWNKYISIITKIVFV